MADTNIDTDTSADVSGNELFDTCDAYGDKVENNDYWCWDREEGDYSQIWTILGLLFAMYGGQFLLIYTVFINRAMSISSIRIGIESSDSMIRFPKIIYWNKSTDFLSLMLNIIIHLIFLFIKISIVSTHYLSTVNDQYDSIQFQQFINARNILVLVILTLSPVSFILNNVLFRRRDMESNVFRTNLLIPFGYILLSTDILFTFIILCIYHSLLIILLYWISVQLLTGCIALCVLICFITLFTAFISKCCIDNQCIRLIEDDIGDIIIEFPRIFTQFLFFTLIIIILYGFIFSIYALNLFFVWYFLGGPPHIIFYANFNKNADSVIYWLFILVAAFGISAFIGTMIGLFNSCFNHQRNQQQIQIHREINNDSDA